MIPDEDIVIVIAVFRSFAKTAFFLQEYASQKIVIEQIGGQPRYM